MMAETRLLAAGDGEPVTVINPLGRGKVLLVCEHASRKLPIALGTLGLQGEALDAHIAWDPGALAVSLLLSANLDAVLVTQNFSRLAYDCNRPPEAADAMPEQSEIFAIPGNMGLSRPARYARIAEIYLPFRDRLAAIIAERRTKGLQTVLVTIHSFTPVYRGVKREVEIGILHDEDSRMADRMLKPVNGVRPFTIRRNEPYGPKDGVTHTLKEHGLANGLLNVMIEVRNDLLTNEDGQRVMADFLTGMVEQSLTSPS